MRVFLRNSLAVTSAVMALMACSPQVETKGDAPVDARPQQQSQAQSKAKVTPAPETVDPDVPCTEAILTGTGGGPAPQFGNAQSGVFIRAGNIGNGCNSVRLQFDAGRGTLVNLSRVSAPTRPGFVTPPSLSALFLTHGHSDHTSTVADIIESRWVMSKNDGQFPNLMPPKPPYKELDVICFDETCDVAEKALVPWETYEIPSRAEKDSRTSLPKANIKAFKESARPQVVWQSGEVKVSAVSVIHIDGSVGYLIETPAGNLCISGDTSYSDDLKKMCQGTEVMIHEVIHPVLKGVAEKVNQVDPTFTKVMDNIFKSHTTTDDFGKLNGTSSVMVLSHIIPPIGAGGFQGIPLVPHLNKLNPARGKGAVKASDFCKSIRDAGLEGPLHVGTDLMTMRIQDGAVTTSTINNKVTDCQLIQK